MMQHSRVRAMYNIEGSTSGDCVVAYFCTKCVVMQDEREVRAREARGNQERNKLRNGSAVITDQPRLHHDMPSDLAGLQGTGRLYPPELGHPPHRGSYPEPQKQADQRKPQNNDKKADDISNHHSDSASNNSHTGSDPAKPQKNGAGEIGREFLQVF